MVPPPESSSARLPRVTDPTPTPHSDRGPHPTGTRSWRPFARGPALATSASHDAPWQRRSIDPPESSGGAAARALRSLGGEFRGADTLAGHALAGAPARGTLRAPGSVRACATCDAAVGARRRAAGPQVILSLFLLVEEQVEE